MRVCTNFMGVHAVRWLEGLCDGINSVDQLANKSFNITLLALG